MVRTLAALQELAHQQPIGDAPSSFVAASPGSWVDAKDLPSLQQSTSKLQKDINALQDRFFVGLDDLKRAYDKAHGLWLAEQDVWKRGKEELATECTNLRNALDRLADDRLVCKYTQEDLRGGLPRLFMKRAREPYRFNRFQGGKIYGCADNTYDYNGLPKTTTCTCPTGDEKSGCLSDEKMRGHELLCTRMMNESVKDLNLMHAFDPGSLCNIDGSEKFNEAIIPSGEFEKSIKTSSCGFLLFVSSPQIELSSMSRRRKRNLALLRESL
mmetsp:Transcript_73184/g.136769  ORF Transcript_73184/g.136769 Transcript_73184/m.136769 type:complete len:270 (-) Transcript_73184:159-968(-)